MDAGVAEAAAVAAGKGGPWPLPDGWTWVTIGDLPMGGNGSLEPATPPDRRFVLYSVTAFERGVPDRVIGREVGSNKQIVPEGALLICKINPRINRVWVVQQHSADAGPTIASTEWIVVQRTEGVEPQFLRFFLTTERVRQFLASQVSGVGGSLMRVNPSTVGDIVFPIAPLAEQRRIVERVDALFAEIAEGEAALAEARRGLDTFRRALLKAAVTGELTKYWRAVNPPTETGHDVLACVKAERVGHSSAQRRSRGQIQALPLNVAKLPDLPDSWAWATLASIGEIIGGVTVDQKRKPNDPVTVPYLRVANVQRGRVDLSEVKTITLERTSAVRLRLVSGDLLLNEGGDRDKIGRGWVWDGSVPDMIHQNHVFRVRLHDHRLNPFFVSHYANEIGKPFFITEGKQTTNLASISLSKISMLPVPIPPPAEVTEILRRVSAALSAADETQAQLDAEAADVTRLKQSILKAAFEGRLVRQDPADEPASELLARLNTHSPPATLRRRGSRTRK